MKIEDDNVGDVYPMGYVKYFCPRLQYLALDEIKSKYHLENI
jgi:hypothetical protein